MTITNSCKKMITFVMAIALVLSVLFVAAPQNAKAAETPSVKVLGATIRLTADDNDGTQSMRIGIQVDNANQAYACAIQLTVGSTSYTVATKSGYGDAVQSNLHSKDVDNNSIVYAVVLKNIPESAYYSSIGILGKAWDKNDVLYTSDAVEKNVIGVVDTIKDKFPNLNICILNGSLYKDAGASKLSADDISGYSNDPDPEMTSNPLSTPAPTRVPAGANEWAVPFERINENAEGEIFYAPVDPSHQSCARTYDKYADELLIKNETTDANADGLVVNLPAEEIAKRYTKVTINYEYIGSGDGVFGYKYKGAGGQEYFDFGNMSNHQFSRSETSKVINVDSNYMPIEKLYIICFSTGISIRIKSIIFSDPKPDYSGAVDLSSATVNGTAIGSTGNTQLNNGVITVNESGSDTTELIFDLPNGGTVDEGEQVAVVVTGSCTIPDFTGFRVRLANANGGEAGSWATAYTPATSREFSEVFTVTASTAEAYKIALKSRSYDSGPIAGLTITGVDVYWTARGAVAPAPMASPSPVPAEPYAPALSSLTWWRSDTVTKTEDANGQVTIEKTGSDGEFGLALPSSELSNQYDTVTIYYTDGTMSGNLGVVEHYNTTTIGWQSGEKNSARASFNGSGVVTINGDPGNCLSALRFYNVPQGKVVITGVVFSSSSSLTPIPTPAPTPVPTATPEPTPVPAFTSVSTIADGIYAIRLNDSATPNKNDGISGTGNGTSGNYILTASAVTSTILNYDAFDTAADSISGVSLWSIKRIVRKTDNYNNTAAYYYLIRAVGVADESVAYLNINPAANGAYMGPRQELKIAESSGNFIISNGNYRLRFTNSGGSGFTSGTSSNTSNFGLYKVRDDLAPAMPSEAAIPAYDDTGALAASAAVARKITTTIVADGAIDSTWDALPYYTIANYASSKGTTEALAKLAWDEDYFYALVRVKDPSYDSTSSNDYKRDGGELFFDEDNSKQSSYGGDSDANTDAFQYRLTGFDNEDVLCNNISKGTSSTKTTYAGLLASAQFASDGYVIEYKIPWANKSAVAAGKTIGLDLSVMDCANGDRNQEIHMFSAGTAGLYSDASLFGTLALAGEDGTVPTPTPSPTPSKVWNNDYTVAAKYELYTPSSSSDKSMLGKEVIFVTVDETDTAYALSASGTTTTKTDISDICYGSTIYVPADDGSYTPTGTDNSNVENYSWSAFWNKANADQDSGQGYYFQNLEDETYLGVYNGTLTARTTPINYNTDSVTTNTGIDYKKQYIWNAQGKNVYSSSYRLNYDGSSFVANTAADSNVLMYVKSYTGDYARKNIWRRVYQLKTGREYLLIAERDGAVKGFIMSGTGSDIQQSSFMTTFTKSTDANGEYIVHDADVTAQTVVHAHSLGDGTFWLDTYACPDTRQTLSINGKFYCTSEHTLASYYFRFKFENDVLNVYKGLSGFDDVHAIKYRNASGCFYDNSGGTNVELFEREL